MADTIDDLKKKAPKVEGVELVKIIKPHKTLHPDEKVAIFLPFAQGSDYQPADAYKAAVKKMAGQGVDENFLLLASVRKLSEKYNSLVVADLKAYTHSGLTEEMTDDQRENKVRANLDSNKGTIETIVRNFDKAWAEPETPGIVTPDFAHAAYDDATHAIPDQENKMLQNALMLQNFIAMHGSNKDKKDYVSGKQFYVTRFKEVEHKGKKAMTIDYVEVWQKKNQ